MVNVKKPQRQLFNKNRKKILLYSTLLLLIFNVFPLPNTPHLPTQDHSITIDSIETDSEQIQTNNFIESTASSVPWWNPDWHYRRVYNISGVGNISLAMNFTSLLQSLQIVNKTFENDTITVVRNYGNGTIIVVNTTWFNESRTFHNRTNALGTLAWRVSGTSSYAVYFDVKENRGSRNPVTETQDLHQSGSVHATSVTTQGWWPEFTNDLETFYQLNTPLQIQIRTTAFAKKVTAFFLYNGIANFNMSLNSLDTLTWSNTTQNLSKIGDWTIRIIGYDDAGYQTTPLTDTFYIGKPDLIASNLSVPPCYIGYNATVITQIRALNTTVEDVNVALKVDGINVGTQKNLTIQKNETQILNFTWKPSKKGYQNVSFWVYYNSDSNQSNNMIWKKVNVEGIPDITVLNISVKPTPVDEGDPVAITAYISNTGDGNATNYEIVLYCEQNQNNITMTYTSEKNSTLFSLQKNTSTNVTLLWQQTRYGKENFKGEWAVGIKIANTTQTPDKHDTDNKRALYHILKVIAAERNPPVLSNLEYPTSIEQGDQILIRVKATDASGIDSVVIVIKTPNKTSVNATMSPKSNDRYEYLFQTTQLGRHDIIITATDLSPNKNQSKIESYFVVTEDQTPPTVSYFGVSPLVQLPDRSVEIRCIATDDSGIQTAEVSITFPDNQIETHTMTTPPNDTKYLYTNSYEDIGQYVFSITVTDTLGNHETTDEKTFWITNDLNDRDDDGMPDDWEERYGLNPYDPADASQDEDNDGVTNLEEYQQGTNPLKKISSSTEILERLEKNWAYLIASLIIFFVIIGLAWYGIRRRTQ